MAQKSILVYGHKLEEHRYPMNNPSSENDQWQLYKLVEANTLSCVGIGVRTCPFPPRSRSNFTIQILSEIYP